MAFSLSYVHTYIRLPHCTQHLHEHSTSDSYALFCLANHIHTLFSLFVDAYVDGYGYGPVDVHTEAFRFLGSIVVVRTLKIRHECLTSFFRHARGV
jgi:hypothetical protein